MRNIKNQSPFQNYIQRKLSAFRHSATGLVSRFGKDRSGAIAIMFGIAVIPILIGAGVAVDYSRALTVKNRLSQAIDAAALAVGASKETDEDVLKQMAKDYFAANYSPYELGTPGALQITFADKKITIAATAELPTTLMNLVGITKMDVGSNVEVSKELRRLEVVMVLDNTGSMGSGGKIDALKSAATDLVNILAAEQPDQDKLKFGLVPFSAAVKVGTAYQNSGWIDVGKQNSLHGIQFENTDNVFDVYNKLSNRSWSGCVEARPSPLDVSDTPPVAGDTLWVPYFAPDEPNGSGIWGYSNSYLSDNTSNSNLDYRQKKSNKYDAQSVSSSSKGPQYNCVTAPIAPLSGDTTEVLNAIQAMDANGYTLIPLGLAWGWRVISPEEPFTEGVAYTEKDTDKAIILLTDGLNNIGAQGNHNKSRYNGYGFVAQGRLGTTSSSQAQNALDTRTSTLCTNIKATGVIVYTITFQLDDDDTETLFRNCATDPSKYYNSPSNAELQTAFKAIAKDLGKLRLSK